MLSINGTTNYSTARIDGVIFTDTSTEVEQIKERITGITYNDVTDTTNIDNNVAITKDLDVTGNLAVGGDIDITGVLDVTQLNVGANADAVAQFASISVGDNYGKIQVSNYSTGRPTLLLENKNGTTQGITIQGPSATSETFNVAFTKAPAQNLFSASRTQFAINTTELFTQKVNTPVIVQPDFSEIAPNEMTNITMYDDAKLLQSGTGVITQSGTGVNAMKSITLTNDSTIIMSGTGTIRQSGTQENYLKDTNLTEVKAEKTLLGYETDEFINKDTTLRRYYPFDTQLGSAYRFYNFNKYFVDGTYTASSMTNTGTQTNNNYVGQVGNSCFEFTNGRYFFNYGSSALYYDTNYMSFGGWVYVTTTATGCRPFFTQTTQSGSYLVLIGGNNTLTLNGDASGYFKGVTVLGSNANNAWWHIFVVIEGTTQKTYRNGTLIDTQTRTLFPTTGEATFGMGVEALSDSSRVDDLRIYSRVLTADEIAAIYRYRGALREDYQTKIHGTTLVGDRADGSSSTRQFNVRSQDGIISIGRYSGSQPGFELLNFNPDTGAVRSTALFLGGGSTDYATMLLRTGGDVFVYWAYRDLFDITVSARVRGANLRVDGNITQPTTTTTNELKSTNITGTLGITGYPDVKATLDTLSAVPAAITGITYNSGTDTTTIDNNVDITKNLILQDDKVVLTSPTGYVMDECEKHTYLYSINRAIGDPYRTIRTTSFEAVDINGDLTVAAGQYVFSLVKIIKGVTYSGVFMINSSVGTDGYTAQMALFEAGIGSASKPLARLAVTDGFTTAKSTLHYANFRTPYTPTETIYAYVGYVITSLAALSPTLRGQSINYNNNYKITTCKTGSLTSLCCGYAAANGSSFDTMGTSLPSSQAMTAYSTQMFCGLYTDG